MIAVPGASGGIGHAGRSSARRSATGPGKSARHSIAVHGRDIEGRLGQAGDDRHGQRAAKARRQRGYPLGLRRCCKGKDKVRASSTLIM